MSVIEYDVIVIGAGVSGLTAGTLLAKQGLNVALVTTGEPTACLSTGCIDVCSVSEHPLKAIVNLPGRHPYHLIPVEKIRQSPRFSTDHDRCGYALTEDREIVGYFPRSATFKRPV